MQHVKRAKQLITRIPHHKLPREFHTLAQVCNNELSVVIDKLNSLQNTLDTNSLDNHPEILRTFRREVENLNQIEIFGIAALERANSSDKFLNNLIDKIRIEIKYPFIPPVVISLSQQYFQIIPRFNLLFVPPGEADFLLHLPDLYHELAHPLLLPSHNQSVTPFQLNLIKSIDDGIAYYDLEIMKEKRRRSPELLQLYLSNWRNSWWQWVVEFFCDLFAVYTLGPAYAWSHLHLVTKYGRDIFNVPKFTTSSHPPDDARMRVIIFGLKLIGYVTISQEIQKKWLHLSVITNAKATPEYNRAFPDQLLRKVAELAFDGVQGMQCRLANINTKDTIHSTLNDAWSQFWSNPDKYIFWEEQIVINLKSLT